MSAFTTIHVPLAVGTVLTRTFTAATTDICTLVAHGFETGDGVRLTTTTTLPAGLALATTYYVIRLTADTFKLAASPALAAAGTAVDITDTGTGTHSAVANAPIGAILALNGAVGPMTFSFQDNIAKGVKYTTALVASGGTVQILESNDGKSWTQIGTDTVIRSGGEKLVSVISQKKFIAVAGVSARGGYVRADIAHRGEPFRGQVTIANFGKRGLSKDYDATTGTQTTAFAAEPAPAAWPE